MIRIDLVNIIYCYVNRFITNDKLMVLLKNIDKTKFSKNNIKEIDKIIEKVKKIIEFLPIEIDKIEIRRITSIKLILEELEKMKENKNNKVVKYLLDNYNNIKAIKKGLNY